MSENPPAAAFFNQSSRSSFTQTKLFASPTAKHRLLTCKLSCAMDHAEEMRKGGLKVLLYTLNPSSLRSSAGIDVVSAFEKRQSSQIQCDIQETKAGVVDSIGFAELFGMVVSAREAADELRNPTHGVVVASRHGGDGARLFGLLVTIFGNAKSAKAKKASCKPKSPLLQRFAEIVKANKSKQDLAEAEAFYFSHL